MLMRLFSFSRKIYVLVVILSKTSHCYSHILNIMGEVKSLKIHVFLSWKLCLKYVFPTVCRDYLRESFARINKWEKWKLWKIWSILFILRSGKKRLSKHKFISLQTTDADGLPNHICLNCHNDLVNYNKFRLLCTASDSYFRQNKEAAQENVIEAHDDLVIDESKISEKIGEIIKLENCILNDESKG